MAAQIGFLRALGAGVVLAALFLGTAATPAIAADAHLAGPFADPQALAVDQASGDVYVVDPGSGNVKRFTANGSPAYFTAGPGAGTNVLDSFSFDSPSAAQVAIAPAGSVGGTAGDIYVANFADGGRVDVYAGNGAHLGILDGSGNPSGGGEACGVATDPAGNVYVTYFSGHVDKYVPSANPVVNGDFDSALTGLASPCAVAAGSTRLYASSYPSGPLTGYELSSFPGSGGSTDVSAGGSVIDAASLAVHIDPATDQVFVDEGDQIAKFDSAGAPVPGSPFGSLSGNSRGVAVNASTGAVYVADSGNVAILLADGTPVVGPAVATGNASDVSAESATIGGTVDPDGGPDASCVFQYGTSLAYGQTAPCSPSGPFSAPADVSAHLTGLSSGTGYHFRVLSSSSQGTNAGEDQTFTTPGAPTVNVLSVSDVEQTRVLLRGLVTPNLAPTAYRFEYVDDAEYQATGFANATRLPDPDAEIGSGSEAIAVRQIVSGLSPDTTYRYRLVATNFVEDVSSPPRAFRTLAVPPPPAPDTCPNAVVRAQQGSGHLSDCRAYEMVSPVDKNGQDVASEEVYAAASGDSVMFRSAGGFPGSPSSLLDAHYRASRNTSQWSVQGISPPVLPSWAPNSARVLAISRDLSKALVRSNAALTPDGWSNELPSLFGTALYLEDLSSGAFTLITPVPQPGWTGPLGTPTPYTSEFSGATPDLSQILFETEAELTPDAVGVTGAKLYRWSEAGLSLESILPGGTGVSGSSGGARGFDIPEATQGRISEDGSRVFFTTPADTDDTPADLYLREGGTSTLISSSAVFRGATPDGERVFFTVGDELRRYDVDSEATTLLSEDNEPDDGIGGAVDGMLGASADGSVVYFAAFGQLVEGAPIDATMPKLYVSEGGDVRYLATIPQAGKSAWPTFATGAQFRYVAPNGNLLLLTGDALTDYDTTNPACGNNLCRQAYLFRPGEESPICVSCNPSGASPTGAVGVMASFLGIPQQRSISEDGSRVFFESPDPLVPGDSNGRTDVYMWEEGQRHLISSGTSDSDSFFIEASGSGDDAFFITRQKLSGLDQDDNFDLYDARVGGGFLLPETPRDCTGDACQAQIPALPANVEPASASFAGAGNVKPRRAGKRCRRNQHKVRHGSRTRCVKKKHDSGKPSRRAGTERRTSR